MTAPGNSLLRVRWKPPAYNGSWNAPILDYTCSVTSSFGVTTKITSNQTVTLDISNHSYGNYLIKVSARNSLGHGNQASVWYFSTTSMIMTAPSDEDFLLIVGVTCGTFVGVFGFFIVTFFVLRHRKPRSASYLTATTEG